MSKLRHTLLLYKIQHPTMNWDDMAEELQISTPMLMKYVNDKAKPRKSTLELLSKRMNVKLEDLTDEDLDPEDEEEEKEETKTEVHIVISDPVAHPAHYCTGKYECIEVMTEVFGVEAVQEFCRCNAFKYLYRSDRKNGIEDIRKAQWYLNKYIELEESKNDQT